MKCELPSISMIKPISDEKKSTMKFEIGRCLLKATPICFLLSKAFQMYFSALDTEVVLNSRAYSFRLVL